jgi:hypothetical protein
LSVSLRTAEKGAAKVQARFGILLQGATFKITPAKG